MICLAALLFSLLACYIVIRHHLPPPMARRWAIASRSSASKGHDAFRNILPHPSRLPAPRTSLLPPFKAAQPLHSEISMQDIVKEMKLQDLKMKTPTELLSFAEEVGVE